MHLDVGADTLTYCHAGCKTTFQAFHYYISYSLLLQNKSWSFADILGRFAASLHSGWVSSTFPRVEPLPFPKAVMPANTNCQASCLRAFMHLGFEQLLWLAVMPSEKQLIKPSETNYHAISYCRLQWCFWILLWSLSIPHFFRSLCAWRPVPPRILPLKPSPFLTFRAHPDHWSGSAVYPDPKFSIPSGCIRSGTLADQAWLKVSPLVNAGAHIAVFLQIKFSISVILWQLICPPGYSFLIITDSKFLMGNILEYCYSFGHYILPCWIISWPTVPDPNCHACSFQIIKPADKQTVMHLEYWNWYPSYHAIR